MKRITALLIALGVALLGWSSTTSAVSPPPTPASVHKYDGYHHTAVLADSNTERSQPALYDHSITADDAVYHRSRGDLVCLERSTPSATYDYDESASLVQVTCVAAEAAAGALAGLAPFESSGVAAETGEAATSSLPKLGSEPNFANPAESPGAVWEWRGTGDPGSSKDSWSNPNTGESLHPDLNHPDPIGPHYDWKAPNGTTYRVYPDGTVVPK